MKTISIIFFSLVVFASCNQAQTNEKPITVNTVDLVEKSDTTINFENYETGKLPQDWSQAFTGKGSGTEWKIIDDNGNKVLAQLSKDNPNYHFNLVVFNEISAKNVELTVKMKGVTGRMDQGGGFVWRYTDKDNYYVVRANPLEDNVVLYKVKDGKRTDLPVYSKGRTYGVNVEKLGNDWNTLKLFIVDDVFIVYLNGKEIFKVQDQTFTNEGKIGLWTKADAVSYFDEFNVKVY